VVEIEGTASMVVYCSTSSKNLTPFHSPLPQFKPEDRDDEAGLGRVREYRDRAGTSADEKDLALMGERVASV
jgi:hypothetical protein